MNDNYSHSDSKMREKVGGSAMPPPEGAWAGIEKGIAPKRRGGFFFYVSILLVCLLGIGGMYLLMPLGKLGKLSSFEQAGTGIDKIAQSTQQTSVDQSKLSATQDAAQHSTSSLINSASTKTNEINNSSQQTTKSKSSKHASTSSSRGASDSKTSQTEQTSKTNATNTSTTSTKYEQLTTTKTQSNVLSQANSTGHISSEIDSSSEQKSNTSTSAPTLKSSSAISDLRLPNSMQALSISPLQMNTSGSPVLRSYTNEKFRFGSWSVEAGVGFSRFQYKLASPNDSVQTELNASHSGERAYEFYGRVNYHLGNNLSFHTGLEYQQESFQTNYTTSTFSTEEMIDTTGWYFDSINQQQVPIVVTNYITTTSFQNNVANNRSSYITIPLGVMYSFPIGIRSELGINASALIGFRTKAEGAVLSGMNGGTIPLSDAYKKSGLLTFRTALRYSFALDEKNKVYIEPWIGFGPSNRSTAALPYTSRLRSGGIRIGFRRNF